MLAYGTILLLLGFAMPAEPAQRGGAAAPLTDQAACEALLEVTNLTITSAVLKPQSGTTPEHCYIRGTISGSIRFHMQLPLRANWNGRLLNVGDGGKDGGLNYDNAHLAGGYAVANSNAGHDSGAEPGASFAYQNLQQAIDFGYRALHLTANASKTVVQAYYRQAARFTYFDGCSTGGRQAMMESQRFPEDFNGILAGAPIYDYQANAVANVWMAQKAQEDNSAGSLAFDKDGNGSQESMTKLNMLRDAVLGKCDANDGIRDGVLDNPLSCKFNPDVDLASHMCVGDVNKDDCFTKRQVQTIKDFYRGPYDSKGNQIAKGMALGTEWGWQQYFRNDGLADDHLNFLFYRESPGLPVPRTAKTADSSAEFSWTAFKMDDYTAGKGEFMMTITDATNPDMTRFLKRDNGKFLLYHGWGDQNRQSEPTVDYYNAMVKKTFAGDLEAAKNNARLFMVPGMGHCRGGPGLSEWDGLPALVNWVEKGVAPESIVGEHRTNGVVDNQRPVCVYPKQAVYTGPAGGQNDKANWIASNFTCR